MPFSLAGPDSPWSQHLHHFVKELLEDEHDAALFEKANCDLRSRWRSVVREKSSWVNARKALATKLQQNLEVRHVGKLERILCGYNIFVQSSERQTA